MDVAAASGRIAAVIDEQEALAAELMEMKEFLEGAAKETAERWGNDTEDVRKLSAGAEHAEEAAGMISSVVSKLEEVNAALAF